jgi:hypothetical protein
MPAPIRHAAFLLALLAPALATAEKPSPRPDPQDVARSRAQEGLRLYGADRWGEALTAFVEADRLYHAPSVSLYIARCRRKLGKLLDARATYDQILAEDLPKDASPQFVQAHVEAGRELEIIKARIPTLQVVVTGVPAGEAQVRLSGAPGTADAIPLSESRRELDPGTYTIEVRHPRHPLVVRTVTLSEGGQERVSIDLAPGAGGRGGPAWILPAAVALGGVGVLGLGVGAVTGGLSLAKVSDIKSKCAGKPCPPTLRSEQDTAGTLGNVSTAGFVIGGLGAAAGGVLLYLFRPRAQVGGHPQAPGWRASVGIGRVDVEGSF